MAHEFQAPMGTYSVEYSTCILFSQYADQCLVSTNSMCSVVPVSEASVIIAVSSTHRKEALEAVAFAIEAVKASTAIWKKARELVYLWSCLL